MLYSSSLLGLSSNRCPKHLSVVALGWAPAEHPCLLNWGAQKWAQPCRGGPAQLAKLCLTQPPRLCKPCKSTLLAHGGCGAHQDPLNLLHKAASQLLSPAACAGAWGGVQSKPQCPLSASVTSQHKAALAECLYAKDQLIHSSMYIWMFRHTHLYNVHTCAHMHRLAVNTC